MDMGLKVDEGELNCTVSQSQCGNEFTKLVKFVLLIYKYASWECSCKLDRLRRRIYWAESNWYEPTLILTQKFRREFVLGLVNSIPAFQY